MIVLMVIDVVRERVIRVLVRGRGGRGRLLKGVVRMGRRGRARCPRDRA